MLIMLVLGATDGPHGFARPRVEGRWAVLPSVGRRQPAARPAGRSGRVGKMVRLGLANDLDREVRSLVGGVAPFRGPDGGSTAPGYHPPARQSTTAPAASRVGPGRGAEPRIKTVSRSTCGGPLCIAAGSGLRRRPFDAELRRSVTAEWSGAPGAAAGGDRSAGRLSWTSSRSSTRGSVTDGHPAPYSASQDVCAGSAPWVRGRGWLLVLVNGVRVGRVRRRGTSRPPRAPLRGRRRRRRGWRGRECVRGRVR